MSLTLGICLSVFVLLKQQMVDNTKTSSQSPILGITQLSTHPRKSPDGKNKCCDVLWVIRHIVINLLMQLINAVQIDRHLRSSVVCISIVPRTSEPYVTAQ